MRNCMQGSSVSRLIWAAAVLLTLGIVPARAETSPQSSEADPLEAQNPVQEASTTRAVVQDDQSETADGAAHGVARDGVARDIEPPTVDPAAFLAFADPETGEIRAPNEQEAEALAIELAKRGLKLQARSLQPLEVRTLANGMEAALLGLESVNFSFAQTRADGTVVSSCGLDHDHAADVATERRATRPEM